LPFCHLLIKTLRCPHPHRWKCTQAAPAAPKTIGEHIKRRRLQLHLLQSQVADLLGVHPASVQNWERGIGVPAVRVIAKIIAFLGNDPDPEPAGLPARIIHARRRSGITQEALAAALNIDPVTLYRWEQGLTIPSKGHLNAIRNLLGDKFIPR